MPPDPPINTPPETKPSTSSSWKGIAFCVGLFVLLAIIGATMNHEGDDSGTSSGGSSSSSTDTELAAWNVCHQFVEDRLKAPSTADFEDIDEYTASQSAGVWTIRGWVDAENSFGAQIRTNYVCQVRSTGGDRFTLVDLTTL